MKISAEGSARADIIGAPIEDLDTPALLLDGPACERNIQRMAAYFADRPCQLRPHFKNHKCTTLARRQQATGCLAGMTCAKVGEAEILANNGFKNVLIANQILGRRKIERLIELARRIEIGIAIDHEDQARLVSEAASAAGVTVGALVEVDIGMGRCGVEAGTPAIDLARLIGRCPGLHFDGIQAFEGHIIYVNDDDERAALAEQAMQLAFNTRERLEADGIPVRVISGGSTSTYRINGLADGPNEMQAGTYPTMDWRYGEVTPEFEVALTVLTRVISRRPNAAVLDVGVKGAGGEFGVPKIKGHPDVEIPFFISEEHSIVKNAPDWRLGDAVEMISSHACTTCNLHREMIVHENRRVVEVWPIEASGHLA